MQVKLDDLKASPELFRRSLRIETDSGPRWFDECQDDWQREDFALADPAWRYAAGHDVKPKCQRFYFERPRGHSKTTDIACMVAWALFAAPNKIEGVCCAADQDQAKLIRNAIDKLVRLNPWLAQFLEVGQYKVSNPATGSELTILSSDGRSAYGLKSDFIVIDEFSHHPKRELWDAMLSTAGKSSRCLILSISNSGYESDWQFEEVNKIRTDPDWCFRRIDGPIASWITEKLLNEQRRLLPPKVYARLWLNLWQSGGGDAFEADEISRAVKPRNLSYLSEPGWIHFLAADIGIKRDATATVVRSKHVGHVERIPIKQAPMNRLWGAFEDEEEASAYAKCDYETKIVVGTGRLRLTDVRVWKPELCGGQVQLADVEQHILDIHARLNLSYILIEDSQAFSLVQSLKSKGLPADTIHPGSGNMQEASKAMANAFRDAMIDLYDETKDAQTLLADISNLRMVERSSGGGYRLESPRQANGNGTRHGDAASACLWCTWIARRFHCAQQATSNRVLVCWP